MWCLFSFPLTFFLIGMKFEVSLSFSAEMQCIRCAYTATELRLFDENLIPTPAWQHGMIHIQTKYLYC